MAHASLGVILRDLDNLKEAELSIRKAIELNPNSANAHSNLAIILIDDLGKLQEAELSLRQAIELNPNYAEAYYNLSYLELLKGDYQSGFEHYEFRFKKEEPSSVHANPKIKKIDSNQVHPKEKLLVVSEQGLGDTLHYMRYIPYLRKQGFDISFCAQKKLHSLINSSGIDSNPLTPEQANQVSEGQWIPLLSLPKYLNVTSTNSIVSTPYIYSREDLKEKWGKILSKEKRPIIGINWQGNPDREKQSYKGRSIPLELFEILLKKNNIKFLSLQKGYGSEQIKDCSFVKHFVDCQNQIDNTWDFEETAAIIDCCDLVISNDTCTATMTGAMGKKVWLLLRDIPYWTWGLEKESTFWYPSMRLFRQKERDNWHEVMERVSVELRKLENTF